MITKLHLKNWRSHLDTNIDFSEGTNCFIGNMGTGKSSIMSGICFALFGTFPELQSKKLKLEDTIMKKPFKQNGAMVELEFSVNGDKWHVKREVEKGHTVAELMKNGQMIESPQPSKVTAEIENVLKINYDLFTRAIYSEQNQLDMFLTIPKGQRMKRIDELLSIDKFEEARATAKLVSNKCAGASSEKRQFISNLSSDSALMRLDSYIADLAKTLESISLLKKQLSSIKIRKIKARKDIENQKEQQEKVNTLHEKIKTTTALIISTESDLTNIKEDLVEYAESTTEELKDKLEKIISETSELQYALGKERENLAIFGESNAKSETKVSLLKKDKIPELAEQIEEKRGLAKKLKQYEAKKVESEFKKEKKSLEDLTVKLQNNIAKISELDESLKDLEDVTSYCPICESELSPQKKATLKAKKKRQAEKLRVDIKIIKASIKKSETGIDRLEGQVKDLEEIRSRLKYLGKCENKLKDAESELKAIEQSMSAYLKQRKMQEKTIDMMQKSVDNKKLSQEKVRQLILKRNEYDAKLDKIKDLKAKLEALNSEKLLFSGFTPSILDRFENEYKDTLVLERELETKIESNASIVLEKEKTIKELESKKKLLDNYKNDISRLEAMETQMNLLASALVSTQEQLRISFVKSVNTAMQAIWEDIYPYNDFYGVRLGIEGGDYVLQLQDSTGWMPADGIASGGERSIACLALRIAFSLILAPQLRWIVLDEPTANLDASAVQTLASILREKITQLVEQCFLITHNENFKESVSGFYYELQRDKSRDGATKISLIDSKS